MSSNTKTATLKLPRGFRYAIPLAAKSLLAEMRIASKGLWKVYNGHYQTVMSANNWSQASADALRELVKDNDHIRELHNQLAKILNEGMGEAGQEEGDGYYPFIYFPIVGEDEDSDDTTSDLSEMSLDALEAIRTRDPGPHTSINFPIVEEDEDSDDTTSDLTEMSLDALEAIHTRDPGPRTTQQVQTPILEGSAWTGTGFDPVAVTNEVGRLYVLPNGHVLNGRHLPDYYQYPHEMGEGTWQDGMEAIEEFDWS